MATSNFYNNNANNIYAIIPENEYDAFIYDYIIDNISNDLEAFTKNSKAYLDYSNKHYRDASLIEVIRVTDEVAGVPFTVSIEVLMRSGYYEGANLDYEINYNIGSVEFDDITDTFQAYFDVASWNYGMNKGLATIQAKNASNRLEAMSEELIGNVEKILKENCTHILRVSARFSNGETWYSEVKTS